MILRVLTGGAAERVDAFRAEPFDLDVHPLRPGMGHEELVLTVSRELAAAVEAAAAADGIPVGLWAGIAIESERALGVVADGSALGDLESALIAAADAPVGGPLAHRGRRLVRYAKAIRAQPPRRAGAVAREVNVTVAHHTLLAWERAAADTRQSLEVWVTTRLERMPAGRVRWESAAAESGQTLSEWIALQAARRSSS